MKRVLVISYSQSGQLDELISQVLVDFESCDFAVSKYQVKPSKKFPFPWPKNEFYAAFPETFTQQPISLDDLDNPVLKEKYDLIILGYQVWFLTPSAPINSFLKSAAAAELFTNTPVVTVIGCRNMWTQAQEKTKALLNPLDAKLIGNIAFVDRHINHISVITIAHWMFGGKKSRKWGIFPKPGVSETDIAAAVKFSAPIAKALKNNTMHSLQEELIALGAARIKPFLVLTDKRANVIFGKWASTIMKRSEPNTRGRRIWLKAFKKYLFFAIWVLAPIVYVVFLISYIFKKGQIQQEKRYFASVEYKA